MKERIPWDELNRLFAEAAEAGVRSYLAPDRPHFELVRTFALGRLEEGRAVAEFFSSRFAGDPLRILDVGAGNGGASIGFANHQQYRVTAVDVLINPALQQLRSRTGLLVDQVVSVGEALPFRNESFDVVLCLDTIEHVRGRDALAREMLRVLKPRGFCMLTTPARLRYLFQPDPHYGIRFLAVLPIPLQRFVAEKVVRRTSHYDVDYLFWHIGQLRRLFGGTEISVLLNEDTAEDPRFDVDSLYRRFFWDRILIQKKIEWRDLVEVEGGQTILHSEEATIQAISGAVDRQNRFRLLVTRAKDVEQELASYSNPGHWQGLTSAVRDENILLHSSRVSGPRNFGGISYFLDESNPFLAFAEPGATKEESRLWIQSTQPGPWLAGPILTVSSRSRVKLRGVTLRAVRDREFHWWGFLEFSSRRGRTWLSEIRISVTNQKDGVDRIQLRNRDGEWVSVAAGGMVDFSPWSVWRASAPSLSFQEDHWELWARVGKRITWQRVELKRSGAHLKRRTLSPSPEGYPLARPSFFRLDYSNLLYWVHPEGGAVHVTLLGPGPAGR